MFNRYHIMRNQKRAHTIGNIENINDEWIFFDEESEEAFLLSEMIKDGFEIMYKNHWLHAHLYENDTVKVEGELYNMQNKDKIRVRKRLQYTYEEWLKELSDEAFLMVTQTLLGLDYSLYDSLFCHNFLLFQVSQPSQQGVNFMIYDNGELTCSLHHHYIRDTVMRKDTFELTRSDGKIITDSLAQILSQ